jgi:hypothetical protein
LFDELPLHDANLPTFFQLKTFEATQKELTSEKQSRARGDDEKRESRSEREAGRSMDRFYKTGVLESREERKERKRARRELCGETKGATSLPSAASTAGSVGRGSSEYSY